MDMDSRLVELEIENTPMSLALNAVRVSLGLMLLEGEKQGAESLEIPLAPGWTLSCFCDDEPREVLPWSLDKPEDSYYDRQRQ